MRPRPLRRRLGREDPRDDPSGQGLRAGHLKTVHNRAVTNGRGSSVAEQLIRKQPQAPPPRTQHDVNP